MISGILIYQLKKEKISIKLIDDKWYIDIPVKKGKN